MTNKLECISCGSVDFITVAKNNEFLFSRDVARCKICGLAFVYPLPQAEEIDSFYIREYSSKHKSYRKKTFGDALNGFFSFIFLAMRLKERLKFLSSKRINLTGKNILEIGSGNGAFLHLLAKKKANVWGVEPSRIEADKSARVFKIAPIASNTQELLPGYKNSYDFIFAYHILEHLRDPLKELYNIKNLLKKGGLFIGEVPFTPVKVNLLSEVLKRSVFDNLHLFHYNSKAIFNLLAKAGFSKIKIERLGLKSVFSRIYPQANIHYLHSSFESSFITKFFSLLQALELILKSYLGLSIVGVQRLSDLNAEWKGPNDWIRFCAQA